MQGARASARRPRRCAARKLSSAVRAAGLAGGELRRPCAAQRAASHTRCAGSKPARTLYFAPNLLLLAVGREHVPQFCSGCARK